MQAEHEREAAHQGPPSDQAADAMPGTAAAAAQAPMPSPSGATSLLMAASTLAHTPAQVVSSVLLDKAHMAAAEGRAWQGRRTSAGGGIYGINESIATSFSLSDSMAAPETGMASASMAPFGTAASSGLALPSADAQKRPQHPTSSSFAGPSSDTRPRQRRRSSSDPAMYVSSDLSPPASPQMRESPDSPLPAEAQAQLEISKIAASTAAHEYIEQSMPATRAAAPSSATARHFDESNPFQGVPSTPMMPSPQLVMAPPPDVVMGLRTPFAASNTAPQQQIAATPMFQPAYRLAPQEYQILASAAAVATAALTMASTATGLDGSQALAPVDAAPSSAGTVRALTAAEQDEIAATLRAWAGLEGTGRQEQARLHLLQLQAASHQPAVDASASSVASTSSQAAMDRRYFPPDFAKHYQSQLVALANGYYNRLHAEGEDEAQWAPVESRDVDEAARAQLRQQARDVEQKESAHFASQHPGAPSNEDGKTQIDPLELVRQRNAQGELALASPPIRDQLLQFAHQLYSAGGKTVPVEKGDSGSGDAGQNGKGETQQTRTELHPQLLPLLHTLQNIHPHHLPTLLLLSCAYYSRGDMSGSLWYNKQILDIDPNYVESMSNIGTTLRALGRWKEAESWWWRAVRMRPGYWDAYENLLGVLCSPQQMPASDEEEKSAQRVLETGELTLSKESRTQRQPQQATPRFAEALSLCELVESSIMSKKQAAGEHRHRKVPSSSSSGSLTASMPIAMPAHLPLAQHTRLQNLYHAKGNLKYVIEGMGAVPAAREYEHAVEIMLSPSEENVYSVRDLVVAVYVCGVLSLGASLPGQHAANAANEIAVAMGLNVENRQHIQLASSGSFQTLCPGGGLLRLVRQSGDVLVKTLLRLGGGTHLPMLMLIPKAAEQLVSVIFAETEGHLPSLTEGARRVNAGLKSVQQTFQQASALTSTVLLTLAKLIQDATYTAQSGPHGPLTLGGIAPSVSMLLPLYYLSISLNPAASTANNLGILLSAIPVTTTVLGLNGERQQCNGQQMAMQYYTYGLQLDSKHPHLYTNLGSLCKDLNHLSNAVAMYEKAIACNPNFDVALANLGNAIKDQGRTQDSIQYYRRAVAVNPRFPEALCGLVNALLAVCEWRDVYQDDAEGGKGLMKDVISLLDEQLEDGSKYGAGALSVDRTPEDWANLVVKAHGDARPEFRERWLQRIKSVIEMGPALRDAKVNEGSFIIRMAERAMRETQRRWYRERYGAVLSANVSIPQIAVQKADVDNYARPILPTVLGIPNVPTVLPFHTFTLKLSARQIRMISHRTALRISQTALSQHWLPPHVYPPPPPPSPRIRLGYISSDFNNHPLAHLMQSCFGFHNRSRFEVFLYATSASDNSPYRKKIEAEAEHFIDVSSWHTQTVIQRLQTDGIHILMNLNGYTKGARNEVFAARPCPVQMEYMGFAGGLASGWTDWVVVDPIVCPPQVTSTDLWRKTRQITPGPTDFRGDLDPEAKRNDWEYMEKFIYMPDSYFVNDHKQGFREPEQRKGADGTMIKPHEMSDEEAWREEEQRRWQARKELWPSLPDDYVIFCDFNQLYKIEPTNFRLWLRILKRVPKSILWLLRFPAAGEANLLRFAKEHFGEEVAARVVFTDVAPKGVHIHRGRIADLFLDSLECGAHTTSADILWSGTPVLTWPKYEHKMASRVAASIVSATGFAEQMVVSSEQQYEDRAVALAQSISYSYVNEDDEPIIAAGMTGASAMRVTAEALKFNNTSASAALHNSSNHNASQAAGKDARNGRDEAKEAPAPANVKKEAAKQEANGSKPQDKDADSKEVLPDPARIELAPSHAITPPDATSRRMHGELADLRRSLYLTRDSNRLFDTRRWVRNLEKGYEEAWRRWVLGIDNEEAAAWEALEEEDPVKQSGHIWVKND